MAGNRIGILALQGAFIEHERALKKCGASPIQVRTAKELDEIDGLIIPGGESTTIGKLMTLYGIDQKIKEKKQKGMPIWGTCAGMALLANNIVGSNQTTLGLMNMSVVRNGFGRQAESFETELDIISIGKTKAVFIRAPYAEKVWGDALTLASCQGKIVMIKQNNLLASAFHPELTPNAQVHEYFMQM